MLGALLVSAFDGDPASALAASAVAPPAPTPTDADRLRASISTVLPSVVTVVTDTGSFGSGIVVADGVVMTNYHVVEDATAITVVLATGEERDATPFADDSPFQDVALLRVDGRGLRVARLGTTTGAALGDPVAIISGGVFDFSNQVKVGVISALGMDFPRDGVVLRNVIQTDAAVNHGDSGGPLIDASGAVIGMMTSVIRTTGQDQPVEGVGLAQSVDLLRPFLESVVANGFNPRPRIGIERLARHHVPLDDERAAQVGLPVSRGAAIMGVQSGSPAEEAGILPGDIVVAVNGTAVDTDLPFVNLIAAVPTGSELRLTVFRDGQVTEVIVRPRPALLGAP
ncbi:MAG: trypsin-like peptidase domain-containing protein [Chloroflexi bacterium]|nr:trypsin-like peptidase domain-containing protein [Chloroflexota bacterium]MDA1240312.1 trypsin-like peptidase domain-containing protein [Chloroflexota bacterium]MQC47777.1 PDZ domain-containing protein [Chloroflexota bacterium]